MTKSSLLPLEEAIAERLIVGTSPNAAALRRQLAACAVRRRDGNDAGCYVDLWVPREIPPANLGTAQLRLSGVTVYTASLKHGAGFVLLIEDGYLSELEGFTFDEPWPSSFEGVSLEAAFDDDNEALLKASAT